MFAAAASKVSQHRLTRACKCFFLSNIANPVPVDGLGFAKHVSQVDKIKMVGSIFGGLFVLVGAAAEGVIVYNKVNENAKDTKKLEIKMGENAKDMKILEIKMGENAKALEIKMGENAIVNAKDMKNLEIKMAENAMENAKDMKNLEIKMAERAMENANEMKILERAINGQFSNLHVAITSILNSSSNRHPVEINDSLRRERHNDVTSNNNGDNR
jgi:hypothetical protein